MSDADLIRSLLRPALHGRDVTDPVVQGDLADRLLCGSRDWRGGSLYYQVTRKGITLSGCVNRIIRWSDLNDQGLLNLGGSHDC